MLVAAALLTMATPPDFAPPRWRLVFSDEFQTSGRPDPTKWNYEEGFVRNQEKQYYTKDRPENARVENGRLVIEARKDGWQGHEVTSASVTTKGRASWTHGRIEVRAKIPTGRGTWPAIWTLGTDIDTAGWPRCGEIDIMENVGYDPTKIHWNVHTNKVGTGDHTSSGSNQVYDRPWSRFHTYSVDWDAERLAFAVDGRPTYVYRRQDHPNAEWAFDKPHYLLLNLAIGGAWGGQQGIDDAIYPARYEIDWVRVYQRQGS